MECHRLLLVVTHALLTWLPRMTLVVTHGMMTVRMTCSGTAAPWIRRAARTRERATAGRPPGHLPRRGRLLWALRRWEEEAPANDAGPRTPMPTSALTTLRRLSPGWASRSAGLTPMQPAACAT